MRKTLLLLISFLLLPAWSVAETWKITSLEWPPFSGKNLPEGGAGIAVLRAALKAEGIELSVEYFPWTRALIKSQEPAYLGVYPTWPEDVPAGFVASVPLFKSPVGLVEPAATPIVWKTLSDLKGKTIGTVQDYGNTEEFMALVKNGTIPVQVAMDDLTNIRKVAAGRLDAAFIDLNNLDYYLKYEAREWAPKLQANKKIIDTKLLVLAINNKFNKPGAVDTLARGAKKIKPEKIIKDYMEKHVR